MPESNFKDHEYLIIGGTTKSATTSLYYYLADHPDVSVSSLKETRFFIDTDYPVQAVSTHWPEGLEKFDTFFKKEDKQLRVEASPDYLYSAGTPQRIKELIPHAKVVFLLRDPTTRIISWYKYAKQRGNLPDSMTFDDYVDQQLELSHFEQAKRERLTDKSLGNMRAPLAYFLSALEHGRYSEYLQSYIDVFGKDRVKVYFYEDLCRHPDQILKDICDFTGIDADFYGQYNFEVFNRSITIKNIGLNRIYDRLRTSIRRYTHGLPIHKVLRQLRLWFDPIYYRLNSKTNEKLEFTPDTREKLENYYLSDIEELERILERTVPWPVKQTA